jgi:hypothetical protein
MAYNNLKHVKIPRLDFANFFLPQKRAEKRTGKYRRLTVVAFDSIDCVRDIDSVRLRVRLVVNYQT